MAKVVREKIVGVRELRENLEKYIAGAKRGESFTVVRRSKPVFRLTPPDAWGDEGTWESIADFTKGGSREGVSGRELLRRLREFNGSDQ